MHFPVASLKVTNNDLRPARYLDEMSIKRKITDHRWTTHTIHKLLLLQYH